MIPQLNSAQTHAAIRLMGNSATSYTGRGSLIGPMQQSSTFKHDIAYDFGYPRTAEMSFSYFYEMWKRQGLARGLVLKTASKTWEENPTLSEDGNEHEETPAEEEVRNHFRKIRFWQKLQEADKRSMVGRYSAVVFQLGDGLPYDQPVTAVAGGITGIVSVIPCWEQQLEPSSWDMAKDSPTYGQPTMYRFNESAVDPTSGKTRSFIVHPDRVVIWSADGTTFGDSKLESCYNALMDIDKVRGGGAEGFWKNAKSQPVLNASADVDFNQLATMLGTDLEGLPDALDEVVGRWSKGFDESLMLQGMEAKTLGVSLSSPEHFFSIALQEVAASWPIPVKELVGMITGERASTEDAKGWAQVNKSRRTNLVIPNIMDIIDRFVQWGILGDLNWDVEWSDLTAPTLMEKLDISKKMAEVNQHMFATGEVVFTDSEIRIVAGYEGEPEGESDLEGEGDDDEDDFEEPEDE